MIGGYKSRVLVFVVLATVCLVAPQTIRAQEKTDAKDKEKEERQELEKKTLALLNDVASSAWSLKLPENRLFIMANEADVLWPFDEKRARTLFWDALNSLNSINPAPRNPGETLSKADQDKAMQAYFHCLLTPAAAAATNRASRRSTRPRHATGHATSSAETGE